MAHQAHSGSRVTRSGAMPILWVLALVVSGGVGCGPAERAVVPARQAPSRRAVGPDYERLVRQAQKHVARLRFAMAFEQLSRCLHAPDRQRSPGRARCLIVASRLVERAYVYYRGRVSYLDDLKSYGQYPGGVNRHGHDQSFLLKRAIRVARSIGDVRELRQLTRLRGAVLRTEAAKRLWATQAAVRAMGLYQREDPDQGPIRTYRYAHQLVRLFPRSPYAPEARFRLLTERRALRLARGGRVYPYYALRYRRDLEAFAKRHGRGPFALRARWELAAIYHDLWLLSHPAFQRTDDYRNYLKVGGAPVNTAAGARFRRLARQHYDACFVDLSGVRSTYRSPARDYPSDLSAARRRRGLLKRPLPPNGLLPATLFPPG